MAFLEISSEYNVACPRVMGDDVACVVDSRSYSIVERDQLPTENYTWNKIENGSDI